MKTNLMNKLYLPVAALLVIIAGAAASTATWFMFYQPREPKLLRKMN